MPRPTVLLRSVYVRALGAVHLLTVASLWPQLAGLVGVDGVLPYPAFLHAVASQFGVERFWRAPGFFWLLPAHDASLHAICAAMTVTAGLLVAGVPFEGPLLLLLWAGWVSLCTIGQAFTGFQWDALLAEATFAALLVARWRRGEPETPAWAWWIQRWLALRLMFFGGLVKLTSGDVSWWSLTALDSHFWTQPLPNPLSLAFASMPSGVLKAGVVFTFVVELLLPVVAFAGRPGRLIAFAGFTSLMLALLVSGNYGTFQLLAIVCCLSLLDDDALRAARLPWPARAADRRGWHLGAPVALLLFGLSVFRLPDPRDVGVDLQVFDPSLRPTDDERWPPAWAASMTAHTQGLRLVNRYGLFARMTTERPEVIFEGSWDGGSTWRELPLPYKPGDPSRRPTQVAPHMPRLDWQLWFAALGGCARHPWVMATSTQLVRGSAPVMGLFARGTFADGPPDQVRTTRWRYEPGEHLPWTRSDPRPFCPVARK
jgi:hypothetical protein